METFFVILEVLLFGDVKTSEVFNTFIFDCWGFYEASDEALLARESPEGFLSTGISRPNSSNLATLARRGIAGAGDVETLIYVSKSSSNVRRLSSSKSFDILSSTFYYIEALRRPGDFFNGF